MRQCQQNNKRIRGRGRKVAGSCNRVYESNGPDVKIRGTAPHIAERYTTLSRDANVSGNYVIAENYMQHAEHYLRFIATMRLQQGASQSCSSDSGEESVEAQPSPIHAAEQSRSRVRRVQSENNEDTAFGQPSVVLAPTHAAGQSRSRVRRVQSENNEDTASAQSSVVPDVVVEV